MRAGTLIDQHDLTHQAAVAVERAHDAAIRRNPWTGHLTKSAFTAVFLVLPLIQANAAPNDVRLPMSAAQLREQCNAEYGSTPSLTCRAAILGALEMFYATTNYMKMTCMPSVGLGVEEGVRILNKYMEDHPNPWLYQHSTGSMILLEAIGNAYPCALRR